MPTPPKFTVVLRGYDREQVDNLVSRAEAALASSEEAVRASARQALQAPTLTVGFRGYDRGQVHTYLDRLAQTLT